MEKPIALLRSLSRRLRLNAQDGSLLIEVMVGAVLVAAISAAVLDGLGGAQKVGQRNKARSVSASLAQQDQERLRSKPVTELSNYHQTKYRDVANITYKIDSRADWVSDASGVVSCTNSSTQAQYLKISTTVSSNVNTSAPVTESSLVAPPRGAFGSDVGTAAVQVVDREGQPLEGVRVDLTGPDTYTDTTNELGCVVFGYVPAGPWTTVVTSLGLVGTDGKSPYEKGVGVVGGSTALLQVELDRPASVAVSFDTLRAGQTTPEAMNWNSMSLVSSRLGSPGWISFTSTNPVATITADKVFPFFEGYGTHAGTCEANNPAIHDPDYFTTAPGDRAIVTPEPTDSATAIARLPAMNIQVQNSGGTIQPGARVFVKAVDEDCTPSSYSTTAASPWRQTTDATGAMPAPAFPFGTYTVCVDNNASFFSGNRRKVEATITNTAAAGTTLRVLKYGTTATSLCV